MIAEQAQCVDFCLGAGDGSRLDLELCSGQVISRLVDIKRSGSNSVMSINELSNQDEIEFQLHDCDDSPGVLLKKMEMLIGPQLLLGPDLEFILRIIISYTN